MNWKLPGVRGYGAVRNMQLIIPAAMGAEVVIALDDDEVVKSDYLNRAVRWVGNEYDKRQVLGVAGPYLDQDGSPYLPESRPLTNPFIQKSILMNQTMREVVEKSEPLAITPMALGGNMVFHRDLFVNVGFDPAITRGEDIDYLINARIAGIPFFFDKELSITHLPPRHYEAPLYGKLCQDVFRFSYEREKLLQTDLRPEKFTPYPGRLLQEDFSEYALAALQEAWSPEIQNQFDPPEQIMKQAVEYAKLHAPAYLQWAKRWPQLMEFITQDNGLISELKIKIADF